MIVLLLGLLLVTILFWLIRQQYSYWNRRNFPTDPDTHIPCGCLKSVVKHEKSMGVAIYDAYLKSNSPFVGVYLLFRPAVLIRDPELARQILIQDFSSFHDRGIYVDEKRDPLSCSLFGLRGQSWRSLRQKLTPSFSSGKLKAMFHTSDDIGNKMIAHLNKVLPEEGSAELDLKDVFVTYAIDIIGSVIFGLEINSFEDPKNKFRTLVHKARRNNLFSANFAMFIFLCPSIIKFMFRLGLKNYTAVGLRDIMKETIEYREKHNIVRKDMLQLMMQLRNTGKITEDDENWTTKPNAATGEQNEFTIDHIGAQGFIFYIAGQETTSSSAAFTIFELAQYPDLLARAKKEVDEVLERHNGQLSYDALREMSFLELCLQETNRKYPLPFLNRECTQDYTIPGTSHVIEKGIPIVIPLLGIHRDPQYFPNPMTYDPDRFLPGSPNYNANAYMPFGAGPRQCIALRMGMINSKLGIVKVLQNFNIEIMSRREIIIDNHSVGIQPKGGVKVRLSKKAQVQN
ncbi:PREDICTED: probable cytochrome P450 6d4 [Rhagoletis zephyria]|uniref:probable cytochrome P450 6d4 n=1 Tax=Rhagoletis zephyria TaxID=28612 RepID=UPI0008116385|nr:PREDICTED: probable cytochrome P450 6d4 [Rhagoletis zephyria]